MNLEQLIGTNPKYPPIVDLNWLEPKEYDNYPSDNQSVRIIPKLHDMWLKDIVDEDENIKGLNDLKSLSEPLNLNDISKALNPDKSKDIIRDIKKVLMLCKSINEVISFIKRNYTKDDILKVKDELKELLKEYGLLGNVYVDLSAFSSIKEAETFLKHNTRLAKNLLVSKDMILDEDKVKHLAFKFHKNVISSIVYDDKLFNEYTLYLIDKKLIPRGFIIDSKEKLRNAFLGKYKDLLKSDTTTINNETNISCDDEDSDDEDRLNSQPVKNDFSEQELDFCIARPVIKYICIQLFRNNDKDIIKNGMARFSKEEIKKASKFAIYLFKDKDFIESSVKKNELSPKIAKEIKYLKNKYPIINCQNKSKITEISNINRVHGYSISKANTETKVDENVINMLKDGKDIATIKNYIISKYGEEDADKIILDSLNKFNSIGMCIKNSRKTIKSKTPISNNELLLKTAKDNNFDAYKDYLNYFKDFSMDVDINKPRKFKPLKIRLK